MTKPKGKELKKYASELKRCALNCKSGKKLFSIPDRGAICKLWLNTLGLSETPLCRSEMYVCADHFSFRQLTNNGKSITPTSIPDKNIPGKQNFLDYADKSDPPPTIVAPTNNPGVVITSTMITSTSSKCVLKCKNYKMLHKFPNDLTSYNIWLNKLGFADTVRLHRTASVCNNHFSPAMRTKRTITTCAVPDMNLPPQCEFIDESEAESRKTLTSTTNSEGTTPSACPPQPIILPEPANNLINSISSISYPQTETANNLTNPIPSISYNQTETANSLTNLPISSFSDLAADNIPNNATPTSDVICPENYQNALSECVLKCPEPKILYRFPNVEARRQLWLSKIGLTHCFCNTRICNQHFSEIMLSNKRLTNSAYPDINLPDITKSRIRVASLPLENDVRPEVIDLPQYICVLTVVSHNKKIKKLVNNTRYVKYTVDKKIPKRERSVQVELDDLLGRANKGTIADEEFDDDDDDVDNFETFESINLDEESDSTIKSQVFPSKTKDMFECLKCGEITVDQESNRRHLDLHKKLNYLCFRCGLKFTTKIKLNLHEMKMHSRSWKQLVKRCPKKHCKKAFHSKKNLNQHLNEHVGRSRHYCNNCGRLFFSSLKLHCHLLACKPKNLRYKFRG